MVQCNAVLIAGVRAGEWIANQPPSFAPPPIYLYIAPKLSHQHHHHWQHSQVIQFFIKYIEIYICGRFYLAFCLSLTRRCL